ncbi:MULTISPECIES: acyl-CoA dehydrogenase [Pseudomonas]|uniref:acyl-CoA dehydrogenase n=1 Tax=Pseudomonas TaxID=286 RepID=UPI001FEC3029|nr:MULTISPECIES: acyl-CoA dehydrogenase [Pseudomonas]
MSIDEQYLKQWVGRQERQRDRLTLAPLNALAATLDREERGYVAGASVPALWHWLYFLPIARQSAISSDGHPQRGGFLPPVSLPRRMWAGGRLRFYDALPVDAEVERLSTILDVSHKSGRSGDLVFVKVRHELSHAGDVLVREEQDIVYRDPPRPGDPLPAPQAAPERAKWSREVVPDPVLLFRYSALTFNGHRIHYDRPYAMHDEGYPGLVVHGPLIATLLMNLLRDELPQARVVGFSFRAVRPLFDTRAFRVCAKPEANGSSIQLWAEDADGFLCMDAQAELA